MTSGSWLEQLESLSVRLPAYGMSADLTLLSPGERWALYRLLLRLNRTTS